MAVLPFLLKQTSKGGQSQQHDFVHFIAVSSIRFYDRFNIMFIASMRFKLINSNYMDEHYLINN